MPGGQRRAVAQKHPRRRVAHGADLQGASRQRQMAAIDVDGAPVLDVASRTGCVGIGQIQDIGTAPAAVEYRGARQASRKVQGVVAQTQLDGAVKPRIHGDDHIAVAFVIGNRIPGCRFHDRPGLHLDRRQHAESGFRRNAITRAAEKMAVTVTLAPLSGVPAELGCTM